MEGTFCSFGSHKIHRKTKKVTGRSGTFRQYCFSKKLCCHWHSQLTPCSLVLLMWFPSHSSLSSLCTLLFPAQMRLWTSWPIRELQARTFALFEFYNYPSGDKCLTFLVSITSCIHEWGGFAILRILLNQISYDEYKSQILHKYLTWSTWWGSWKEKSQSVCCTCHFLYNSIDLFVISFFLFLIKWIVLQQEMRLWIQADNY